jgi:hypothetical protein
MTGKPNKAAYTLAKLRAKSLTPARRSEIAKQAATAKWAKLKTPEERAKAVENANKARRKSLPDKE